MADDDKQPEQLGVFERMGQIIEAVRAAGGVIPSALDPAPPHQPRPLGKPSLRGKPSVALQRRIELSGAIDLAFAAEAAHLDITNDKRAEAAYKRLGDAIRHARELSQLLADEALPETISIRPYYSRGDGLGSAWPAVLAALKVLPDALRQERARLEAIGLDKAALVNVPVQDPDRDPEWVEALRKRTSQNVLFRELAETFREFFEGDPNPRQKRDSGPDGPFVAFVIAVHAANGRKIKPEAVRGGTRMRRAGQTTLKI